MEQTSVRQLSNEDFTALGLGQVAYLRKILVNGQPAVGVFAANGIQLAVLADWQQAQATAFHNDLELATVH